LCRGNYPQHPAALAKKPVNELTPLEMWTFFFGYANRPEYEEVLDAIFKKKKEIDMAGTLLKSISKDERERAHFRSRRMFQTDMESNRITAEQSGIEIGVKRAEKRRKEERKETAMGFKAKGHLNPATTQRYAHLQDDPLHRATKIIGKNIKKAMGIESKRPQRRNNRTGN